jgi:hypothetical protein
MTVPEAQERIEALTVTLASCANSPKQRAAVEAKMARCYRAIQRAQQRAHQSLASVSTVLLEISDDSVLNAQQAAAIIAAVHLIRCATTEQLAVALPAAIHESSTDSTPPAPNKFSELSTIVCSLLNLDSPRLPFEERTAIHTALHLMNIAGRPQIHHSMRQGQAFSVDSETSVMLNRLKQIYAAYRPRQRRSLDGKARSGRAHSLDACSAIENLQ